MHFLKHTYLIPKKPPQQQFDGNMRTSAVITSWELLTKCQTITFIMNSSDELQWLPIDFISSQQWVQISIWLSDQDFRQTIMTKFVSWVSVAFPLATGWSVMMIGQHSRDIAPSSNTWDQSSRNEQKSDCCYFKVSYMHVSNMKETSWCTKRVIPGTWFEQRRFRNHLNCTPSLMASDISM